MITVYTKDEVCDLLNITHETLDDQLQSGKISYHKISETIVFTEKDILTLLDNCEVPATVENEKYRSSVTSVPIEG